MKVIMIELWLYRNCCLPVTHYKGIHSESDNDMAVVIQDCCLSSDSLKGEVTRLIRLEQKVGLLYVNAECKCQQFLDMELQLKDKNLLGIHD